MNPPRTAFDDSADREVVRGFDLRALPAGFYDDPYPTYRALRDLDPVHRCPDGSWFLTRYADCLAVYRDRARMSSDKRVEFAPKFGDGPLFGHHTTSLVFRDPPYHTRVRKLVHHFFTPRSLAAMEPRLVALVDRMLDAFEARGAMDLVSDYAFALPVEVVCDLLGVPKRDRAQLREWARAILGALEPMLAPEALAAGNSAVEEFSAYLRDLAAHKRARGAREARGQDRDRAPRRALSRSAANRPGRARPARPVPGRHPCAGRGRVGAHARRPHENRTESRSPS